MPCNSIAGNTEYFDFFVIQDRIIDPQSRVRTNPKNPGPTGTKASL